MNTSDNKNKVALILVISLFFLWALTANLLPVLIPHLKKATGVNTFQASLVDSAYWLAYFLIAIPAGMMMKRFGYKITIITGLILAATGAFLFPLAADSKTFSFFLIALFVVASGMTFLETSANPFIREFGSDESYAQRLNFAQAFNGLGAVVATNFLNHLILSDKIVKSDAEIKTLNNIDLNNYYTTLFDSVKLPYMFIGVILIVIAILFLFTKFNNEQGYTSKKVVLFNPLQSKQLTRSMIAQFFYVGGQVCISSFFILYAEKSAGFSLNKANYFLGFLLISFMIGRYVGSLLMLKYEATKLLMLFALGSILLSIVIVFIGGIAGIVSFIGVEFFMSIMYPTIFSLGVKNMKDKTEIASSYMVMMIVGGALLPPVFGYISDLFDNVQYGYIIPLLCFIIIFFFAKREMKTQ